jgi:hypothetical protein
MASRPRSYLRLELLDLAHQLRHSLVDRSRSMFELIVLGSELLELLFRFVHLFVCGHKVSYHQSWSRAASPLKTNNEPILPTCLLNRPKLAHSVVVVSTLQRPLAIHFIAIECDCIEL